MRRIVVACDQALTNTGYAVASLEDNRQVKLLELNTKETEGEDLYWRISLIKEWLLNLLERYPHPEAFFVEEVFTMSRGSNRGDSTPLIRVQTVINLELYEEGIPFHIISSSFKKSKSWRKVLNIDGGATTKKLSKDFLYKTIPLLEELRLAKEEQPKGQTKAAKEARAIIKARGDEISHIKVGEHSADAFCILLAGLKLHISDYENVENPDEWREIIVL